MRIKTTKSAFFANFVPHFKQKNMQFATVPYYKRRLRSIIFTLFNRLEYNNNAHFEQNGESLFVKNLLKKHQNSTITVFDIGANKGDYTQMLLDMQPSYGVNCQISAFEPQKTAFPWLQKRFGQHANVRLFNYGISGENTQAQIYFDAPGSTLASLFHRDFSHFEKHNLAQTNAETIELKTLEWHIKTENTPKIHFLKIDIEGNELTAFKGLGAYLNPSFIEIIQFEYGGANLDAGVFLKQLFEILEKNGYAIYKITPKGLEKKKYSPMLENFQYANYVAM